MKGGAEFIITATNHKRATGLTVLSRRSSSDPILFKTVTRMNKTLHLFWTSRTTFFSLGLTAMLPKISSPFLTVK